MKEQPSFAELDYQHKRRRTRREEFLQRMDSLIPWQKLESRIRPHYFRAERGSTSLSPGGDAAGAYRPTVLQPERSGYGRPAGSLP